MSKTDKAKLSIDKLKVALKTHEDAFNSNPALIDDCVDIAEKGLKEVSHLTEHEDNKAGRILTFLGLFVTISALLYTNFKVEGCSEKEVFWLKIFFLLYILLTSLSCLILLYATYPKFNIQKDYKDIFGKPRDKDTEVSSYLFAPYISRTAENAWVNGFFAGDKLKRNYLDTLIVETYLVAGKVSDKFKAIRVAAYPLILGLIFLAGWFLLSVTLYVENEMNKKIIFTDADNTLWETNKVFETAQLQLLDEICQKLRVKKPDEPLKYVRFFDQKIGETHALHYKYPIEDLIGAIEVDLTSKSKDKHPGKLTVEEIKIISKNYHVSLDAIPSLRPGVKLGLNLLKEKGFRIIVLSEGDKERVARALSFYELTPLIDRLIIQTKKVDTYKALAKEYHQAPSNLLMVGDQIDRDIDFSKEAGFKTVYFPGNWMRDINSNRALSESTVEINSFDQIVLLFLNEQK